MPDPFRVLLVEDNPGDVELVRQGLAQSEIAAVLDVVEDGEAALAYLSQARAEASSSCPDLVLLDLDLPLLDGWAVLRAVKSDEHWRRVPVIVMTTSSAREDVQAAYANHANAYVPKPMELDRFVDVVCGLCRFWFDVVSLPGS